MRESVHSTDDVQRVKMYSYLIVEGMVQHIGDFMHFEMRRSLLFMSVRKISQCQYSTTILEFLI